MSGPRAPAWVGIGAQRSGTSWFTRLMLRHPAVCLASCEGTFIQRKELHFFDRVLHTGASEDLVDRYHRVFAGAEASHPGEFTASYLRLTWVAGLMRRAASSETVVICLLRDPVERFFSAIRWSRQLSEATGQLGRLSQRRGELSRLIGGDALWGGMYATQLRSWTTMFDPERFVTLCYETAVEDPAAAVGKVWSAMGLAAVDIGPPLPPVETSSRRDEFAEQLEQFPDLRALLQEIYLPEILELEREWGIQSERWTATWL